MEKVRLGTSRRVSSEEAALVYGDKLLPALQPAVFLVMLVDMRLGNSAFETRVVSLFMISA